MRRGQTYECQCVGAPGRDYPHCGRKFTARAANALYCARCMGVRQALSMRRYANECQVCGMRFFRRDSKQPVCVNCLMRGVGARPNRMGKACSLCGRGGQPEAWRGSSVCARCVESTDEKRRAEVNRALLDYLDWTRQRVSGSAEEEQPEQPEHGDSGLTSEVYARQKRELEEGRKRAARLKAERERAEREEIEREEAERRARWEQFKREAEEAGVPSDLVPKFVADKEQQVAEGLDGPPADYWLQERQTRRQREVASATA